MARRTPPDLTDQVIVITGANSGIGKEAAVTLAGLGATVVMTARNPARGEAALTDVRGRSGSDRVELMALDLADFASIRSFAAELLDRFDRLDVLVNNAGGIITDRESTAQGFEMTFGVNHLGHFLLTELLLDRLRASAPSRVVTVSSVAHRYAISGLSFEDLQSDLGYQSMSVYSRSKLANLLFANELARRLDGTGVTSNSLHPGAIRSGFGRSEHNRGIDRVAMILGAPFLRSPKAGSKTIVFLASSPEVAGATGGYFVRRKRHKPSKHARDEAAAQRLWDQSELLIEKAGA